MARACSLGAAFLGFPHDGGSGRLTADPDAFPAEVVPDQDRLQVELSAFTNGTEARALARERQKPSSARPTQLTTNRHDAIAVSEANVTIVWTDGITGPRCGARGNSVEQILRNQGASGGPFNIDADCGGVTTAE
jgi:hypothetical protein